MNYDNILRQYWPEGHWTVSEGASGWNNTTRYVEAAGSKWVLRIYAPYTDPEKIRYEHEVLRALNGCPLPYAVPNPVTTSNGDTFVRVMDETARMACLFPYREGNRPSERDTATAYAIGVAAAQLSEALAALIVQGSPVYPPYYELDAAHPRCTPARVAAFCKAPPEPFAAEMDRLHRIEQALSQIRVALPQLRELPHQLIHGDINASNLLGDGRKITAVLDFEFCTRDVRAMEISVIATGFLSEQEDQEDRSLIAALLQGYGSRLKLSRQEAEVIPLLASLRKLDVFLHFLGRYWDGVDDAEVVLTQLRESDDGLRRLAAIALWFRQACLEYLT